MIQAALSTNITITLNIGPYGNRIAPAASVSGDLWESIQVGGGDAEVVTLSHQIKTDGLVGGIAGFYRSKFCPEIKSDDFSNDDFL